MAQLIRERDEALEREKASAEVLRVISSSPGELEPVFQMMLQNATRICDAMFGAMYLSEGNDVFRIVAMHNAPPAFAEMRWRNPVFRANPRIAIARAAATKQPVQIADAQTEPGYLDPLPGFSGSQIATLAGGRTLLGVPLLKENKLVGAIGIYRQEVLPFTERQIALVQNFAAQAVIAIENTRLLNELRESLAQQTATADVLQVISSSPGELEPVFQAMLENAVRLCEAKFGDLYLRDRDGFRMVATHNSPPAYAAARRHDPLLRPPPDGPLGLVTTTKQVAHIPDITKIPSYVEGNPFVVVGAELGGYRTVLAVPMVKDNELVGAITFARQEVGLFTDRQIELVKNFAHQAVIAIDNTRLLTELRESLQQQTATADVLKVISRLIKHQLGEPLRGGTRFSLRTDIAAIAAARKTLSLTGDPDTDWLAVRRLIDLAGHAKLKLVAEDARFIRLLNRGTQLRENLAERWRVTGSYADARDIVSGALLQEHFSAASRVWTGVNVMTIHKAKGKEFDEVIIFEGAHAGRLVREKATERDIEQARLALRVGATRARSRTIVLTPKWQASPLLF